MYPVFLRKDFFIITLLHTNQPWCKTQVHFLFWQLGKAKSIWPYFHFSSKKKKKMQMQQNPVAF